jgi:hypothetical protein
VETIEEYLISSNASVSDKIASKGLLSRAKSSVVRKIRIYGDNTVIIYTGYIS